jgi:nucleoside-diphosphate-sugar epimerase
MSVSLLRTASRRPVLITGGAGFIGTNVTGWRPKTNVEEGLRQLHHWISINRPAASAVCEVGS